MKKLTMVFMILVTMNLTGCTVWSDGLKEMKSDISGLDRVCTIYLENGDTIVYEGKIRLDGEATSFGHILVDGKRISVYHTSMVCIEK